jgi:hypothetical protein
VDVYIARSGEADQDEVFHIAGFLAGAPWCCSWVIAAAQHLERKSPAIPLIVSGGHGHADTGCHALLDR